jgi:hypothetical protein
MSLPRPILASTQVPHPENIHVLNLPGLAIRYPPSRFPTRMLSEKHIFSNGVRRVFDESRALYRVVKIDRNIHHRDAAFRCIAHHMNAPRQYNCAFA